MVGQTKFDPMKSKAGVSFKKKTFDLNPENVAFEEKGKLVFLIDFESNKQYSLNAGAQGIDPKLMQAHFTQETLRQLSSKLQMGGNWMLALIIGALAGVGGIMGGIVLSVVFHIGL